MLRSKMFVLILSLLILSLTAPMIQADEKGCKSPIPLDKCCVIRGDVVEPPDGMILIDDVMFMIAYLFKCGTVPSCLEVVDCADPPDGIFLVNDVIYVIEYLFNSGPPPAPC
jgi:hypothetical protein